MNGGISRHWQLRLSVCYVLCVEASLLSIESGQHKSDMTFPQDVKLQEMGVTAGGL